MLQSIKKFHSFLKNVNDKSNGSLLSYTIAILLLTGSIGSVMLGFHMPILHESSNAPYFLMMLLAILLNGSLMVSVGMLMIGLSMFIPYLFKTIFSGLGRIFNAFKDAAKEDYDVEVSPASSKVKFQ